MIITVKVKANRKENRIKIIDKNILEIAIKEAPIEGRANKELIKFLSKELGISKSSIIIKKGFNNPIKLLEIDISENDWNDFLSKLSEQLTIC